MYKGFTRSRSALGEHSLWSPERQHCTLCFHTLNRAARLQSSGFNPLKQSIHEGQRLKPRAQHRKQHSHPAQHRESPGQEILSNNDADGSLEGNTKEKEKSPARKSKIREQLKAWEQEQIALAQTDPAIAAKFHTFQIGTEFDSPEEQDLLRNVDLDEEDGTPYNDRTSFDERDDADVFGGKANVRAGDIVVTHTGSVSKFEDLAVYCQQIGSQHHLYTLRGTYAVRTNSISFENFERVSGIIDPKFLEPILPHLPRTEIDLNEHTTFGSVPRSAAHRVHTSLAKFSREALAFYQKHRKSLDNIYELNAHESQRQYLTMNEICRNVLDHTEEKLSSAQKFAIHSSIVDHIGFAPMKRMRDAELTYILRSAKSVRSLETVIKWTRAYQEAAARASKGEKWKDPIPDNPFYGFVEKARRLILQSRKLRKATTMGVLGPSMEQPGTGVVEEVGESFSPDEQMILELLLALYVELPRSTNATLLSVAAVIIRAIGAYPKLDLDRTSGYMLLQELGLFPPWTNSRLFSRLFNLPNIGGDAVLDDLYQKCLDPEYQSHLNDLPDKMADIRHDWGDLPVFCIDSDTTTEVDDGFSIERIPGEPDLNWVHIHIADPSAFIVPDEVISEFAKRTLSTTYTVEHNIRMLPGPSTQRFSLAPDRPAMTVSALCSMDGTIKDCRITPSIIHNVVRLTPEQLQMEFSVPDEKKILFTVGKSITHPVKASDVAWKAHLDDIYALKDVLVAQLRRKRGHPDFLPARRGFMQPSGFSGNVSPQVTNAGHSHLKLDITQSRRWKGDPTISLAWTNSPFSKEYWEYSAEDAVIADLVSEVMLLAGEAGSLWCKQRNIPIIYNATKELLDWPIQRLQHYLRTSNNTMALNWPSGVLSSTPSFHHMIGIDQYTKLTSPLRRYGDLLNHWQINSYLRSERDQTTWEPPFTKADIDEFLRENVGRQFRLRKLGQFDSYHWKMHALFRAYYFREAELPDPLYVRVFEIKRVNHQGAPTRTFGLMSPFNFKCEFVPSKEGYENEAKVTSVLPVKVVEVSPSSFNLFSDLKVEAIGLPLPPGSNMA